MKRITITSIVAGIIFLGGVVMLFIQTEKYKVNTPQNENVNISQNASNSSEPDSYISCGCGCCGFDEPIEKIAKKECLFKSKGENIQRKIDQDKELSPEFCATAGCSFPIRYIYCD